MPRAKRPPDDSGPEIKAKKFPCIPPGEYMARCISAKAELSYRFGRWQCILRWELSADGTILVVLPQWLRGLGEGKSPQAMPSGSYWREWVRANNGQQPPGDDLPKDIFLDRVAKVRVGDIPAGYSAVQEVLEWQPDSGQWTADADGDQVQVQVLVQDQDKDQVKVKTQIPVEDQIQTQVQTQIQDADPDADKFTPPTVEEIFGDDLRPRATGRKSARLLLCKSGSWRP
jgi:hypothetical protein